MIAVNIVIVLGAASSIGALTVPPKFEPTGPGSSDSRQTQKGVTYRTNFERFATSKPGRVLHLSVQRNGSAEVLGFELRDAASLRGEILSAEDWRQMPLSELFGDTQSENIVELRRSNSGQEESRERVGALVPATLVDDVAVGLHNRFPVDIFFASWSLPWFSAAVLDFGPLATLEFPQPATGEMRLLSSTLSLTGMEGNTLLTVTQLTHDRETRFAV